MAPVVELRGAIVYGLTRQINPWICLLLSCFGSTIVIPLVYYFNRRPLRMGGETAKAYERFGFEAIFPASTEASNFINQGIVVLLIGLILSLYPMYKVIRLNPLTAMKR